MTDGVLFDNYYTSPHFC